MNRFRNKVRKLRYRPCPVAIELSNINSDLEIEVENNEMAALTQQVVDDLIARALTQNNDTIQRAILERKK